MRISATSLDNYQAYLNDALTKDELIQRITSPFEPNVNMRLGTAVHYFIEHNKEYDFKAPFITIDGFNFCGLETILDNLKDALEGTHEVKNVVNYQINGKDINLVSKLDLIHGNHIYEHKTTLGYFDLEKYIASWQWKAYLFNNPDATKLFYNVIGLKEIDGIYHVNWNEKIPLFTYKAIRYEMFEILDDFSKFIINNNLETYFEDK